MNAIRRNSAEDEAQQLVELADADRERLLDEDVHAAGAGGAGFGSLYSTPQGKHANVLALAKSTNFPSQRGQRGV